MNIYTDGSCLYNPGPGGWAVLILEDQWEWEISGSDTNTTNNKMELQAVVEAIKFVNSQCLGNDLCIYSDSQYVINGITKWIENWIKKEWKKIKNVELWKELYKLTKGKNIQWEWVKAHADNKYNNRVDKLARYAAKNVK